MSARSSNIPLPPYPDTVWELDRALAPLWDDPGLSTSRRQILEYVMGEVEAARDTREANAVTTGLARRLGGWWVEDQIPEAPQDAGVFALYWINRFFALDPPADGDGQFLIFRFGALARAGREYPPMNEDLRNEATKGLDVQMTLGELNFNGVMMRMLEGLNDAREEEHPLMAIAAVRCFTWALNYFLPENQLLRDTNRADLRATRRGWLERSEEAPDGDEELLHFLRASCLPRIGIED